MPSTKSSSEHQEQRLAKPKSVQRCFFYFPLFRKNITRFWPIWGIYLAIWLFLMPLHFLSDGYQSWMPLDLLSPGLFLAISFGVLSAMGVFSFLYNTRSVQLLHALPVRREGLFLTNYLSGLTFLLVPNGLIFLLSLLTGGIREVYPLVLWLVAQSLICLLFYSFAVFCAMFTGNLVALPIFYGILNVFATGLLFLITTLLREFLFGFSGATSLDSLVSWLTPSVNLAQRMGYNQINGVYILEGLPAVLIYGLAGLVLAVASLFIYRLRRLESAGDLVSIRWVRPVFKYGVAFCSAVALGTFLYYSFRTLLPRGTWGILIPLLLCGLVGYFCADMLLKKNFRIFATAWKGALGFAVVLLVVFSVANMDLFGFNTAPSQDAVVSVQVTGLNTRPDDSGHYLDLTFTDTASIETILKLHNTIAASKDSIRGEIAADNGDYALRWRNETLSDGTSRDVNYFDTTYVYFTYTLTNGHILRRSYHIPIHAEKLEEAGSLESILNELLNRPEHVEALYWDASNISENARLVDITLDVYAETGYTDVSVGNEEARTALLAAVKADMAAGRIGTRYLLDTAQRYENCYYNDLVFSFYEPPASPNKAPSSQVISSGTSDQTVSEGRDWTVRVTLQKTATETLKVLAELGYSSEGQLVTWSERQQWENTR